MGGGTRESLATKGTSYVLDFNRVDKTLYQNGNSFIFINIQWHNTISKHYTIPLNTYLASCIHILSFLHKHWTPLWTLNLSDAILIHVLWISFCWQYLKIADMIIYNCNYSIYMLNVTVSAKPQACVLPRKPRPLLKEARLMKIAYCVILQYLHFHGWLKIF